MTTATKEDIARLEAELAEIKELLDLILNPCKRLEIKEEAKVILEAHRKGGKAYKQVCRDING